MANAVKNQADATEPGQQVTALKSESEKFVDTFINFRDNIEKAWREGALEDNEEKEN